jgi:tetratricopeptide (TPR) repeat protein
VLLGLLNPFRLKKAFQLRAARQRYRRRPGPREAMELGRLLVETGDRPQAMDLLQAARRSYPKATELRKLHETLLAKAAASEIQVLERALRSGATAEELARLIELHRSLRNFDRCLQVVQEAERRFPDSWLLKLAAGKAFYHRYVLGRSRDDGLRAVESLRRVWKMKPDCARALLYLSALLCELGQREEAAAAADDLVHLAPTNERAKRLRARLRDGAPRSAQPERQRVAAPGQGRPPSEPAVLAGVMEELVGNPAVLGAFIFDAEGATLKKHVVHANRFDMDGHEGSIFALARAARFASENIGIGDLRTCLIEAASFRVHIADLGTSMVAAFSERTFAAADFEKMIKRPPLEVVSQ